MRNVAIIQARMGSSRLPGKVLLPLGGIPVLRRVYDRVLRVPGLSAVAVATSTAPADDELARFCRDGGIPVYRGSEDDVLDRYYRVARELEAEAVMRITADCPLIDPRESARVLEAFHGTGDCEYACNVEPPFLPDGMDTEVVRFATLERLRREVTDRRYREHVTLYIRRHMDRFHTVALSGFPDLSGYRLTLDLPADFERLQALVEVLDRHHLFGYVEEVVAILRELGR